MDVILMERIEKLGQMGDIVKVKSGYARNFLLPQKKARRATKENLAFFEQQRAQLETDNIKLRSEAEQVAKTLNGLSVTLIRQAGENGQLYGSVSGRDLADAVTEAGVTVDRSQISLDKVIKVLGIHAVKVRLHPEVTVAISANVARSEEEAKTQAKTGHVVSSEEQAEVALAAAEELEEAVAHAVGEDEELAEAENKSEETPDKGDRPEEAKET